MGHLDANLENSKRRRQTNIAECNRHHFSRSKTTAQFDNQKPLSSKLKHSLKSNG